MAFKKFQYPLTIKEQHLDTFAHVNNAAYLILLEEARWDLMNQGGFNLKKIQDIQQGPTILKIEITFKKELKLYDAITIESQIVAYERKIAQLSQNIYRSGELCCESLLLIALFDMNERKLIMPTAEWLSAIGYQDGTG